jgi:hypothetical protein
LSRTAAHRAIVNADQAGHPKMQRCRVDPSAVRLRYLPLLKELNGDFRRHFFNCALHFLGGVRQSVCVDVNSNPTSAAAHVIAEL